MAIVPFDCDFSGCKFVGIYIYVNGLGYRVLAAVILQIYCEIVERYTELLATNSRSLLELLMSVDEHCVFSLLSVKLLILYEL